MKPFLNPRTHPDLRQRIILENTKTTETRMFPHWKKLNEAGRYPCCYRAFQRDIKALVAQGKIEARTVRSSKKGLGTMVRRVEK